MQSLVLFEDEGFVNLLPLVYWRTVFELRIARRLLLDRTAQCLGLPVAGVWTRDWIAPVAALRCGAPANTAIDKSTILANGRWVFDEPLGLPKEPCVGVIGEDVAYIVCNAELAGNLYPGALLDPAQRESALKGLERRPAPGHMIRHPWDLTRRLDKSLRSDWQPCDASIDANIDSRVVLESKEWICIGERSRVHPTAVIDAGNGPVLISHDVAIGAHSVIEGPIYIGPGTQVNPHSWLHGGNAVGPVCRLGGEISGCVIHGYTNKQHGGFLGNAVVGSWVNIGAGTENSNLKNTYGSVRVPINGQDVDSGQTFFGAVIGDHAKLGINTTIPTGAVIGFAATTLSSCTLPKYVPSFGWVTDEAVLAGDAGRLLDTATKMMVRRSVDMIDAEVELFLDLGGRVGVYEARAKVRT